jgi:RimJ/RimL family protein N-acetyltransferase
MRTGPWPSHPPGVPPELLTLRDGRVVAVRPFERRDRPLLEAAIGRLSDDSRYLRFASPRVLDERELDRLVDVDHHVHEALLAIDPLTRRGVAVVRYVQLAEDRGVVELAASVADDWQGVGLGSAMLTRLTQRALDEGYSALRAYVLAVNRRAIAMLRSAGFRRRSGTGVLLEYEVSLVGGGLPPSHRLGVARRPGDLARRLEAQRGGGRYPAGEQERGLAQR